MEHFAVLIDAENVGAKYVKTIFDEIAKIGYDAPCRRIYGNWAKYNGWKEDILLEYSIMPIQQFAYTSGKNSTDMAMVIDAMDLMHQDKADGFCLVTSDSDFTRLAMRLREEKKYVLGMGESKAPMSLTHACDKFIFLNLIESEKELAQQNADADKEEDSESVTGIDVLENAILNMLNGEDEGKMDLGAVGDRLGKRFPDFDSRNYGYSKLSVFIKEEMPHLEVVKHGSRNLVQKGKQIERAKIEEEIISMLEKRGGKIDNLSVIYDELMLKYSGLDFKDYGYGRISSFLRSISALEVVENTVSLRQNAADGEKRVTKRRTKNR